MTSDQTPASILRLRAYCKVTTRTPAEWLAAIRAGDVIALEECDRLTRLGAIRSSRHRERQGWGVFTDEEIEDIVADCRLKLLERLADNNFALRERYFESYILTVVTHHMTDIVRDRIQQPEQPLNDLLLPLNVPSATPSSDPRRQHLYAALDGCLSQLGARYRQIVDWYCQGMPRAWIAAQLDPPSTPGAVGVRWNEIRQRLRFCLKNAGFAL